MNEQELEQWRDGLKKWDRVFVPSNYGFDVVEALIFSTNGKREYLIRTTLWPNFSTSKNVDIIFPTAEMALDYQHKRAQRHIDALVLQKEKITVETLADNAREIIEKAAARRKEAIRQ